MDRKKRLLACRLYGIADMGYIRPENLLAIVEQLLSGGMGILQLRAKGQATEDIRKMGKQLLPLCRSHDCLFILNDYPDIAAEIGADGVHLGQDDGDMEQARQLLGGNAILGRSTHSPEQAVQGFREGADYIGFGPLFPTGTKPGRRAIGLEGIASVHAMLPGNFPIFCIGGINGHTLPAVMEAGGRRAVIVSWLLTHARPMEAVRQTRVLLGENLRGY